MLKCLVAECRRTFKLSSLSARLSGERKLRVSRFSQLSFSSIFLESLARHREVILAQHVLNENVNSRRWYVAKENGDDPHKPDANYKKPRESSGRGKRCIDRPLPWPSGQREKFMFHKDIEDIMNEQINAEFKAFYYYLSMAAYFGRVDVALPGCESFFMQMHHEEHGHALRFVKYINMRGGQVHLCPISPPDDQDWECPLHAFKTALQLEKEVAEKLVATNTAADKHGDLNASDFIVTGFMEDQMKSVNEMAKLVTILSGVGDHALARFMFDKDLLENYVMPEFNILKKNNEQNRHWKDDRKTSS